MRNEILAPIVKSLCVLLVLAGLLPTTSLAQEAAAASPQISAQASNQIRALMQEKANRTPAQRKISSHLLYGIKAQTAKGVAATIAPGVKTPRSAVLPDATGKVLVDIRANVTKALLTTIQRLGGKVIYSSVPGKGIRARMPIKNLEALAANKDIFSIRPAIAAATNRVMPQGAQRFSFTTNRLTGQLAAGLKPGFAERAQNVASQLAARLPGASKSGAVPNATGDNKSPVDTAGDVAHRANEARDFFGVNGSGVKVGVLSDSVDHLDEVQAAGNLPDVTVLPGQSGLGEGNSGEGTAILEIVHALAPGAQLFFATAFTSEESFADNIRALRAAGCDIIIDDVFYFDEPPFQDGIVAQAVIDVTNSGAQYFSSAGNAGNFDNGTAGTWQGDFKSGGSFALLPGGDVNAFTPGMISDLVLASGFAAGLFWSDPWGASSNDYDLYDLSINLDEVFDASTDAQTGTQDPVEFVLPFAGERLVVVRNDGAEIRALHLNTFRGILGLHTAGTTHGHNSVGKAFGVAAVDVATAHDGPFVGGAGEPVEAFSSDGPRRVFFKPDGTPISAGKLTFQSGGGTSRRKPDVTAADGVQVTTPGFNPFFGTSAAAPHAAAVAALLKSAKPNITSTQLRNALTGSALDIQAAGYDRDAGSGIVTAFGALQAINAQPQPTLDLTTVAATPNSGSSIGPGESGSLTVGLINNGGLQALNIQSTLTTSTAGVTVTQGSSTYPTIAAGGGTGTNQTPFTFSLAASAPCGLKVDFTLTVTFTGNTSPRTFTFSVLTGKPGPSFKTTKYTGPVVPIPDDDPVGVDVPIQVSGVSGLLAVLRFRIGGSACSAQEGATTVGVDHTFVGDLAFTLTSPHGTKAILINRPGSGSFGSSGNNFCQTLLDDSATNSIQGIADDGPPPQGPPYKGTFKPFNPLAVFGGEDPNGTWTLHVSDNEFFDSGNVRAFSLLTTKANCQ